MQNKTEKVLLMIYGLLAVVTCVLLIIGVAIYETYGGARVLEYGAISFIFAITLRYSMLFIFGTGKY